MPRFVSYTVALIAFAAMASAAGYVLSRWYAWEGVVDLTRVSLTWSLYATIGCCAYAALVGVYHTFLSLTGLDEEPPEGGEAPQRDVGGR